MAAPSKNKTWLRLGLRPVIVALILTALGFGQPVVAQDAATDPRDAAGDFFGFIKPYIDPFHDGTKYRLVVFGDSLAEGVWSGLRQVLGADTRLEIKPDIRRSSGFAGIKGFDWNKHLASYLETNKVNIAVVMLGTYDKRRLVTAGNRFRTGTPRWRQAYAQKVDQFIRQLARHNAAVYWLELPISGHSKLNGHFRIVNEIVRERAQRLQVKYIDTWDKFATPEGRFKSTGPDLTGRKRRLRAGDRLHFTFSGYAKLANLVKPLILADVARAEAARNIELTGKAVVRTDGTTAGGENKRETRQVEAAVNRHDRVLTPGNILNDGAATPETAKIAKGRARLNAEDAARAQAAEKKLAVLKQRRSVIVKVFLRGEKLDPKSGRADDFSWPPGE